MEGWKGEYICVYVYVYVQIRVRSGGGDTIGGGGVKRGPSVYFKIS